MLNFSSIRDYWDEDREQGVFRVQSTKCWYRVAVKKDLIVVLGPGVEEEYLPEDLPKDLTPEALALNAVLCWEEQEK